MTHHTSPSPCGGGRWLQGRGGPRQSFRRSISSPWAPPSCCWPSDSVPCIKSNSPASGVPAAHVPRGSQVEQKESSTCGKVKLLGGCRLSAVGIEAPKRSSWYLEKGFCITTPQCPYRLPSGKCWPAHTSSHFRFLPLPPPRSILPPSLLPSLHPSLSLLPSNWFCIQLNIWSSTAG